MPSKDQFSLKLWGTRGSIPCPGPSTVKYGGNTTCFEINCGSHRIIIDAGTGIRLLGRKIMLEEGNLLNADLKNIFTHTEQVIHRLNTFKILRSIEKPSFKHLDKILVVIGNIINQFGPVIDSNTSSTETIAVRLPDHDYLIA